MNSLEQAILITLAYFDVFDYPLTPMEVWRWLYVSQQQTDDRLRKAGLAEVVQQLEVLKTNGRLSEQWGFYALPGRAELAVTRLDRYRLAERKYHRAIQFIRVLRFAPFVRMIAVCNTLAYSNSRRTADIDLFIVTSPGRIWQARFWVAGFLKFFKLRPTPGHTEDALCASFFTDTNHLNLEPLALPQDIYLQYWVSQVVPVFDRGVYQDFLEANRWIRQRLPQVRPMSLPSRRRVVSVPWLHRLIEFVGGLIPESVFRRYQLRIMPPRLRSMANQDSRVVVQDSMLKFHDTDRRQQYLSEWRNRVAHIV
ncbi:MAG: hypothetical protein ACOYUK_05045 [Patescibacteria group bacterium]